MTGDAPTHYSYRLSEEENLFRFYFSIFERLIKKTDLPFALRADGFATDDQPQLTAIRDALANLLIHSDYFSPVKPRIRVFIDRIEFLNPNSLPKDLESIIREDFTMPRNPIVTKIFRVIKLAENAGSGIDKMINGWKAYYENVPAISGGIDYYKITFPLVKGTGVSEKTSEKIILLIKENPSISAKEIAEKLGVSPRAIEMQIAKLKKKNIIIRIGPAKSGQWAVVDK
ncbi:MAG: winged helix-turn-helix transcriptional regulator [Methanosarcinales archaeon]|nr:MAG: winged helix-turn-helix transcriptional regulator [Methanosarcinales archaeon]